MGGDVGVVSTPGRGSIFYFTARLLRGQARVRSYLPHPDLRGRRVLVVDDNALALKIMSEMLRSMTFRVEVAGSGEQSIAATGDADRSGDPFAIVFLDWRMPGLDGIETARRMAAMPLAAPPRRILVTAYGREEVFHKAEGAGFDGVLIKPVSPSLLFDAALKALGGNAPIVAAPTARRRDPDRPEANASAGHVCCSSRTTSSINRSPRSCSRLWGSRSTSPRTAKSGFTGCSEARTTSC